jgi:hypothetical protein
LLNTFSGWGSLRISKLNIGELEYKSMNILNNECNKYTSVTSNGNSSPTVIVNNDTLGG